jgi:predicted dehydrogenase
MIVPAPQGNSIRPAEGSFVNQNNLSRRGFLQRSLAAMTVGTGLPLWYARETLAAEMSVAPKKVPANDHIQVGVIGTGDRFKGGLFHDVGRHKDFVVVAGADVDKSHCDAVGKLSEAKYKVDFKRYTDFRELCGRKDIDAVVIATPDHWHVLAAIAAMKSGKDIYCEKPLTLTIAEGQAVVRVARATDRVFQVGSQQRSDRRFRLACELVRNGRIGKIKTVETRIGENPQGGPFPVSAVPAELDWDFWLGQTPKVDYVKQRCHYEFRWWREYSGGKLTDWGAHHNDIAQWGLGMDGSGPVSVEAKGDPINKESNSYNHPKDFTIKYAYASGAELICTGKGENGIKFIGEGGEWIFVDRDHIRASDKKLLDEPLPKDAHRLYVSNDHMGNWRDCLKSRKRPICDVEIGHRSVTVCHLANIALQVGGKLQWDPAKEEFVGNEEAQKLTSRPMRAPWKLEV